MKNGYLSNLKTVKMSEADFDNVKPNQGGNSAEYRLSLGYMPMKKYAG